LVGPQDNGAVSIFDHAHHFAWYRLKAFKMNTFIGFR